MTLLACEWFGCVSVSDLVSTREDGRQVAKEALARALAAMHIDADPCEWHRRFLETPIGTGDVFLFTSRQDRRNVFVIDLHRELTDQLDLVSFGGRCAEDRVVCVKQHIRQFFDGAAYQVGYEEGSVSARFRTHTDRQRYPRAVAASGYAQQLIER